MGFKHYSFAFILLLFSACTGQKKVSSLSEWKGRSIEFGSGGGFSGSSTIYTLLENGQLFSQKGIVDGPVKELTAVDKKKVKVLFASASKITWPAEKISEPGNIYSVIRFKHDTLTNDITWGNGKYTPAQEIANLFSELNKIVSTKN